VHDYRIFDFKPLPLLHSPFGRLNQLLRWLDLMRLDLLARQIAREIDSLNYDLVYVHPDKWTQAPTLLSYVHSPTVYYAQESLRASYEPEIPRPYLKGNWRTVLDSFDPLIALYKRSLARIDQRNTRRANHILTNSRFTAVNIQNIYKREAHTIYLGVDSDTFRPLPQVKKENYVLSVGELRPNKGYDFLIKSISLIPKEVRPPLRIVGNATMPQEYSFLLNLAQANDVDLEIEVMVDLETLILRYNQAALLVYAPVLEPFGLVALEAMACNTAVVGVNEGGVQESVLHGQTGLLVERDLVQFAEAVQYLLCDPELAALYGKNGRQHVLNNWTWEQSAAAIEQQLINCSSN
jgi:glycosyltransferase involved in cell wall biosynthesis